MGLSTALERDQYTGLDAGGHADRFGYGHDRNGNRLYEENLLDSSKSELYHDGTGYDKLDRLISFARGTLNGTKDGLTGSASRSQEWSLDALGNWDSFTVDGGTAQTRTHDSQNRITAVSGATSPTHSANGEMTRDETGKHLTYDAWGRLVLVDPTPPPFGMSGDETTYAYDALNRRITHDGTGLYYSSQWQVLEERDTSSGAVEGQYVWSPVYVDAMVLRERDTDPNTSGLEERLYVTHDANFNVTSIIGLDGSTWEVIERYVYDPYGERTVLNADWTVDTDGLSDVVFVHGHQGGRHDLVVGLVDFRNRFLDTSLGRWTRQDPLGYVDGSNLFYSVSESPVDAVDPFGLHTCDAAADCSDCWQTCVQNQHFFTKPTDTGVVICREDGCQCACLNLNPAPRTTFNPQTGTPADQAARDCKLAHEEYHVKDDVRTICDCGGNFPCPASVADSSAKTQRDSECFAAATEIKCLEGKKGSCGGDPVCLAAINAAIKNQERYCASFGGNISGYLPKV